MNWRIRENLATTGWDKQVDRRLQRMHDADLLVAPSTSGRHRASDAVTEPMRSVETAGWSASAPAASEINAIHVSDSTHKPGGIFGC
jgi:hypothetical protein